LRVALLPNQAVLAYHLPCTFRCCQKPIRHHNSGAPAKIPSIWAKLPLRRPPIVQLPQRAIQIELLLRQQGQLGVVAAALGPGNQLAQLPQPPLDLPLLNLLEGALNLALFRGLVSASKVSARKARCAGSSTTSMGSLARRQPSLEEPKTCSDARTTPVAW